jgi:hypothetical protein
MGCDRNLMIIVMAANCSFVNSGVMNERTHATGQTDNRHESTYALLICSEEKSRNVLEVVIYPLLILGPVLAIWQFAQQPINVPAAGYKGTRWENRIAVGQHMLTAAAAAGHAGSAD